MLNDNRNLRSFECPEFFAKDAGHNILEAFYKPLLENSIKYDRLTGYFSSMVFTVLGEEFYQFFSRQGKMRVVCSPNLSRQDIDVLSAENTEASSEVDSLKILLNNSETRDGSLILSYLINENLIDFRIADSSEDVLAHEKIGIAKDPEGNKVSFMGSINETAKGWAKKGNIESFDVFRSWEPGEN